MAGMKRWHAVALGATALLLLACAAVAAPESGSTDGPGGATSAPRGTQSSGTSAHHRAGATPTTQGQHQVAGIATPTPTGGALIPNRPPSGFPPSAYPTPTISLHPGPTPVMVPTPAPAPTPTPTPAPTATPTPGSTLVFDEEFTGSPALQQWTILDRAGDHSNLEEECYKPTNVTVSPGLLTLTDRALNGTIVCGYPGYSDSFSYTSAMVQTTGFNFTYGTVEFSAKMPTGGGQWPGLWLLGANCQSVNPTTPDNSGACQWPVPGSDEIDVFEGKGSDTTLGYFNLHTGDSANNDNHWQGCNDVALSPIDTHSGFHVYRLDWRQGSLDWYVDGTHFCHIDQYVPATPMFLIMNVALGGGFGGTVDPSVMPQSMQVQWVKVYQ
jgi:beta-glucanase (GH16 family)